MAEKRFGVDRLFRLPRVWSNDERLWHPGEGIGYSALPNMWHRLVKTPKRWWKKLYPGS
ncbi:hypothetical protein [Desulfosoma sp.]